MTKPHCPVLGRVIQYSKNGDHPDVLQCLGGCGFCTLLPSGLTSKGKPISDCETCQVRPLEVRPDFVPNSDCVHRGAELRKDVSNLCGRRGEEIAIYSCAKHGECSLTRYCRDQDVRVCLTCQEYRSPERSD